MQVVLDGKRRLDDAAETTTEFDDAVVILEYRPERDEIQMDVRGVLLRFDAGQFKRAVAAL